MNQVKQKLFFDSPESGKWINRFDVLWIKRDHRRILNVQPRMLFAISDNILFPLLTVDWKVLSN